jgi:hypothetical protein
MKDDEDFPESLSLFHTESLLVSSPAVASASGTGGIQSSLQNSLAGTRDNAACDSSTVPARGVGGAPAKGNTHLILKRIRIIIFLFSRVKCNITVVS